MSNAKFNKKRHVTSGNVHSGKLEFQYRGLVLIQLDYYFECQNKGGRKGKGEKKHETIVSN
jgi:hypothetical protein